MEVSPLRWFLWPSVQRLLHLLLLLSRGGVAQDDLPPVFRDDGQQWRILNAAPTTSFWALLEVEFHVASTCDDIRRGSPMASSHVLSSDSGAHPPSYAFDLQAPRGMAYAWWADCGSGGCGAMEQYIGLDFELRGYEFTCVRILQVQDPAHVAESITLERWDGSAWVHERTFPDLYGGYFINLPVIPHAKWRILPMEALADGWKVLEMSVYADIECRSVVGGTPCAYGELGNGTDPADLANPSSGAFDGDLSTSWTAPCGMSCDALGPWLELNLVVPGEARCFRFHQASTEGARSVLVQAWTGSNYQNASTFLDLNLGSWDYLARWEVTDRGYGVLWRLLPEEVVHSRWKVFEIELHTDVACSVPVNVSTSIGDGAFGDATPNVTADGDVSTVWQAPREGAPSSLAWIGRHAGAWTNDHVLGTAWIGVATSSASTVRCVRLLQGKEWDESTSSLVLQVWNSTAWEDYTELDYYFGQVDLRFRALTSDLTRRGQQAWLRMPAVDRVQWRVSQHDTLFEHWALKELHFYEAIDCTLEVVGQAIAGGEDPLFSDHPAHYAFDHELSTEWWSSCSTCASREAWLGIAPSRPRNVRCVKLFQTSRSPSGGVMAWWTSGVDLDKWNGHQWVKVNEYSDLSRGAWDWMQLYGHTPSVEDAVSGLSPWSTEENTLWRVRHTVPMLRRWAVASLAFFEDLDCQQQLSGEPIGSGDTIDFSMASGLNDGITTEWLSSCESCDSGQAWLGQVLPQPRVVQCVRLFQSVRQNAGSEGVRVERFNGAAWEQVLLAKGLQPDAWEHMLLLQQPDPADGSDNRQQWRVANEAVIRESWRIAGIKFFTKSACKEQAEGFVLESGHAQGFGPDAAFGGEGAYWESSCWNCPPREAWLGLSLEPDSPPIRCVQLRQTRDPPYGAEAVSVQLLREGSWTVALTFDYANLGAWDHLHINALPPLIAGGNTTQAIEERTMWRLVNRAHVDRTWAVRHLAFFEEAGPQGCDGLLPGAPVASGETDGFPPSSAQPSKPAEEWRASCIECAPGASWIGVLLASPSDVRCVEFEQSEEAMDTTLELTLEVWDGSAWAVSRTFGGLSGGVKLMLSADWEHPADLQQFRIVNLGHVADRWRILELTFYTGIECTMEVQGFPISSSNERSYMPVYALDGDPETFWEVGGVPPFPAESAWLGAHYANPVDVKCAMIRQSDLPGKWSDSIALERSWNSSWDRMVVLDHMREGGWFGITAFRSAAHDIFMNFQDADSETPEGWQRDSGLLFGPRAPAGMEYGWSCELLAYKRDFHEDWVLDTGVEASCPSASWEVKLLAGRYYLRLTYSNPGFGVNTTGCIVEGREASVGRVGSYERATREVTVDVADALLTFNASRSCDSISAMEVFALPSPLTMWRVTNGALVPDRWHVHEFELHDSDACAQNVIATRQTIVFSSGHAEGAPAGKAVDNDVETLWASACVGCAPGDGWLAVSFESLQVVKCLRLYQSVERDRQADAVVLEQWSKERWEVAEVFNDAVGGLWGQYNSRWMRPPFGYRWRLVPANGTLPTEPLRLAEAAFFADAGCAEELPGFAIASKSRAESPSLFAFDGDFGTEWASECGPCAEKEAWVGLHYDSTVNVLCAAAALGKGAGEVEERRLDGHSADDKLPLRLEGWNGTEWVDQQVDLLARPDAWAFARRLRDVESLGAGQGWRLVNGAATTAPWRIQEIQFYLKTECDGLVKGTPVASSEGPENPSYLAFDGSKSFPSAWVAGCSAEGCAADSEWIGSLFEETQAFQCIQIYQASRTMSGDPASPILRLERWGSDGRWETVRTFGTVDKVPSGRWATLQVLSAEQKFTTEAAEWRFVSEDAIERHWAVAEIKFFDNPECVDKLQGTAEASGEGGNRFVTSALDGREDTYWWSQENPASTSAWLGLALGKPAMVRCVQLLQSTDPDYSTLNVQLQSRPEADWLHIRSFSDISSGSTQNFQVFEAVKDKPDGAMWRISNYGDVFQSWVIVELEFYTDQDCVKIEVGQDMAPGYKAGQDPAAAFDVRLNTQWRSPCSPCSRGEAWLGVSFFSGTGDDRDPRQVDVRCVVLLQGAGEANSSESLATQAKDVTVERWDGEAFRRVGRFYGVPAGEYVKLLLGKGGVDDTEVILDLGRKEQLEASQNAPIDDPEQRRQELTAAGQDSVRAEATMYVDKWPTELTSDLDEMDKFNAAFTLALRAALATMMRQPVDHTFAEDVVLKLPSAGAAVGSEAALASITALATVFVTLPSVDEVLEASNGSSTTATPLEGKWETDVEVVYEKMKDISEDPYNTQALFLTEELKVELRRSTRLEPLLANVITQVDPSVRFRLGNPNLILANPTTTPPPTEAPTEAPEEPEDNTWLYVLMLIGVFLGVVAILALVYRCFERRRLKEEKEMWQVAHPGVPFPRRRSCWQKLLCPRLCPCCLRFALADDPSTAQTEEDLLGITDARSQALAIQQQVAGSLSRR